MAQMQAVVVDHYGGPEVLQLRTVEQPIIGDGDVLIRSRASTVNPVDCTVRRGELKLMVRLKLPAVIGIDIAGEVVEVGSAVKDLAVGDEVWGFMQLGHQGAYAQYVSSDASWVRKKPKGLSFQEAAAISGAGETAVRGLRNHAHLATGESVLLIGASGGVGSLALQIARAMGATVTAVCGTQNVARVKSLGADEVVDYKTQDVLGLPGRYDIVFDCVGQHSFWEYKKLLKEHGRHVVVPGSPKHMLNALLSKINPHHSSDFYFSNPSAADLDFLCELVDAGKLRPVIERVLPLDQVAEGHRLSEAGRTVGKIVLDVA